MASDNQAAVVEFLASPQTHGEPVERIDTHSAIVFLTSTRAWKLKRAVRFDYLDFSTVERRKAMCEAEVRLNRRTAPALYRGVVAVTRKSDGSLALGGEGTALDWVVEMQRFDQDALFDRLAASKRLPVETMVTLAQSVASFHASAEPRRDHGGAAGMRWVIDGNAAGFAEFADVLDPSTADALTRETRAELDRRATLLEARRESGRVRQCHGDLHLRNIVLLDGRPTLFDAVEFNDEIACTDVLYDFAFLLMDLWRRQLPQHANTVWNGYLAEDDDLDGLPLMPLFLSCRAGVRAKTSATAARVQPDPRQAEELRQLARAYLTLASRFLHPPAPALIAVGGLSGSGKSTLARALAPHAGPVPGAVWLRSDEIRKRLCGVSSLDRLGPEGYGAEISTNVYATAADRAAHVVRNGHTAIVDAVYARPRDRTSIERAAAAAGVPFTGIWLDAPRDTLIARVERRRLDPSDADAAVVRQQSTQDAGAIGWHRIDAAREPDAVVKDALAYLSARGITNGRGF